MTILNPFLWQSQGRIGLIFLIMANVGKRLKRDLTHVPGVFLLAVLLSSSFLLFILFPFILTQFAFWVLNIILLVL